MSSLWCFQRLLHLSLPTVQACFALILILINFARLRSGHQTQINTCGVIWNRCSQRWLRAMTFSISLMVFNITAHFLFFPLLILIKLNYPVEVKEREDLRGQGQEVSNLNTQRKEYQWSTYVYIINVKLYLLFENDLSSLHNLHL